MWICFDGDGIFLMVGFFGVFGSVGVVGLVIFGKVIVGVVIMELCS